MKKLLTLTMLLLVVMACKKDIKKDAKKDISENTFLTAIINGKEFSSSLGMVSFSANGQTFLTTPDNFGSPEYEFKLIIKNDKENNPNKTRYGFIELKDSNRKTKTWTLPDNFDFTSTQSDKYLEGTFSFVANASFNPRALKQSTDQLKVTNGKFKARITN